ncbi:hypothetical protein Kosp01_00300 [Kocuria sp. NBRC 114282]|nr:hypothetical protein Kosp01_00300 [Kocuria sp. NBRC 114282]
MSTSICSEDGMSTTEQDLTIGPAAAALGVSVRTLRHWDDLGILRPAGRAASGYRLYSADDVVRGRRILAYRELGFSLDEVTALLHEPAQQTVRRLRERRSAAEAEARRLQAAQDDLDRLADALEQGILLSEADQAEAFGPDWDPQWTREARDRWGGTDAWTEQAERGARRGPEQWARLAAAPCPARQDVTDGSVVPGPLRPPGRRSGRLARAGDRCPSPITGHRPGDRGLGATVTGSNVVGRRC